MDTIIIHTVRFLGTTDDVTACECCGKQDLKGTVALSINDGDAVFYGCVCAARALGRTVREVRTESRRADDLARGVKYLRESRRTDRFCEIRDLFLDKFAGRLRDWSGRPDTFAQLATFGSVSAGWDAFKAFLSEHGAPDFGG